MSTRRGYFNPLAGAHNSKNTSLKTTMHVRFNPGASADGAGINNGFGALNQAVSGVAIGDCVHLQKLLRLRRSVMSARRDQSMTQRPKPADGGEAPPADMDFGAGSTEGQAPRVGGHGDKTTGAGGHQKKGRGYLASGSECIVTGRAETHLTPRRPDWTGASPPDELLTDSDFEPVELPVPPHPDEVNKYDLYRDRHLL